MVVLVRMVLACSGSLERIKSDKDLFFDGVCSGFEGKRGKQRYQWL